MFYVPDLENYQCFYVRSEGVIRAYETIPTYNSVVNYRDYYIDSHYTYADGQQSFSTYSTLPTCLSSDVLTSAYVYRNDFSDIMIIFTLIIGFVWFFISKLVKTFFRGFKKW